MIMRDVFFVGRAARLHQLRAAQMSRGRALLTPEQHRYGYPGFRSHKNPVNTICRLNTRQIGYNFASVAREAYKVSVDIDINELKKPSVKIDLPINSDVKNFIKTFLEIFEKQKKPKYISWIKWCEERQQRYPVILKNYYKNDSPINPYAFCDVLSKELSEKDIVVSSNGASCVIPIQTMIIKKSQRHIVNSGCAAMGYGLPAAIGACLANNKRRVICLEGDGSIQLNIQELQTVVHHNLPIKIFIFNNQGYLSIRTTQKSYFNGHLVGESEKSGVSFPDMVKVGNAYGICSYKIDNINELIKLLPEILNSEIPILCDIHMDPNQIFSPRVTSRKMPDGTIISSPLEDMYPFLDNDELLTNMIIKPI